MSDKEQSKKVQRLIEYVKGLKTNENARELYTIYKDDIKSVTPQEAFIVFYSLIEEGTQAQEVLTFLDKVINAFYHGLMNYKWEKPRNDNFLNDLINENEALERKMNDITEVLKEKTDLQIKKEKLLPKVEELKQFNDHYLKKENILFPYLEKAKPEFHGLTIMWALHDVVRNQIKKTIEVLHDKNSSKEQFTFVFANLFLGVMGLKLKEEAILFPAASDALSEDDWYQMHKQSLEYGFPFIEKDFMHNSMEKEAWEFTDGMVKTETGSLSIKDMLMIFDALPLDLTFVDENNKVRYFSKPKERFFPRSPAIIGRDVKNCHPPDSVHIVEEIVESFRMGKQDFAQFWINMKGKTILIQYFALRDEHGAYKGVLEASQDITEIKDLEGERRLLKWNE